MDIHKVLEEIVTSSVLILGVYGLIITTSQDIFETIKAPKIEGAPIPENWVYKYHSRKANRLRIFLRRIPWALLWFYGLGTGLFIADAVKLVDILPQFTLQLEHFKFAIDVLNFISLVVVMYVVACVVSVRSNR